MAIGTNDRKVVFNGNGSTTVFAYDFRIENDSEIIVEVIDSDGNITVKTLTTDYSVSGAGSDSGGNVTFLVAPASGSKAVLRGATPITQDTDYIEGDRFPIDTVELALDKLTKIAQEQEEKLGRAVLANPDDVLAITFPSASAGKYIGWNSTGTALENKTVSSSGDSGSFSFPVEITEGGTGATTASAAATNLGLGTGDSPTFVSATLTGTGALKIPVGTQSERPVSPTIGDIRYNTTLGTFEGYQTTGWKLIGSPTGGYVGGVNILVSQTSHTFATGDVLRYDGTDYVKAQADSEANSAVLGIVMAVIDTDFVLLLVQGQGIISFIPPLTPGVQYYLSPTTAGEYTTTKPSGSDIVKPLFIALTSNGTVVANVQHGIPASSSVTAASQAEQETGTDVTKFVSPGRQHFHKSAAKAWVSFNGTGTVAIRDSYNVSSITDHGVGDYTINFSVTFSSANYCPIVAGSNPTSQGLAPYIEQNVATPTTTAVRIRTVDLNKSQVDPLYVYCAVFGDI